MLGIHVQALLAQYVSHVAIQFSNFVLSGVPLGSKYPSHLRPKTAILHTPFQPEALQL